jgi:hypothetical protein
MGYTFGPKGFLQGLQGFFLQIDIAKIVIHKTDQPGAVVNFFDADGLACEGYAEVDLLVIQAKTSAAGDHDGAVMERVVRFSCQSGPQFHGCNPAGWSAGRSATNGPYH